MESGEWRVESGVESVNQRSLGIAIDYRWIIEILEILVSF